MRTIYFSSAPCQDALDQAVTHDWDFERMHADQYSDPLCQMLDEEEADRTFEQQLAGQHVTRVPHYEM